MNKITYFSQKIYNRLKRMLPEKLKAMVRGFFEKKGLPLGELKHRIKVALQFLDWHAIKYLCLARSSQLPLITIVVPVYNHSRYLRYCLDSLARQAYPNIEIIVLDDASTEGEVAEILNEYQSNSRFRIFFNKSNQGITRTLNHGLQLASGDFIAFVDCDDILYPFSILEVVKQIGLHPDVDYFFSDRNNIDEENRVLFRVSFSERPDLINFPFHQTLMKEMFASHLKVVRRDALKKVGLLDPSVDGCQDYDLALRFSENCRMHYIPKSLYKYRWHSGSVTLRQQHSQQLATEQCLQRAVRRRYLRAWEPSSEWASLDEHLSLLYIIPKSLDEKNLDALSTLISELALVSAVKDLHIFWEGHPAAWAERFAAIPAVTIHSLDANENDLEAQLAYLQALIFNQAINVVQLFNSQLGYLLAQRVHAMSPRPFIIDTLLGDRLDLVEGSFGYRFFVDHRVSTTLEGKALLLKSGGEFRRRVHVIPIARFSAEKMAGMYLSLYKRGFERGLVDGGHRRVSIVILSFNRFNALKRCIESIEAHTKLPYELVILDNGSSHQETLAYCHELSTRPNVKVLFEEENLGCSLGRRKALRYATGDYFITLDNDIEVTPGWLEALIFRIEEDNKIAGACCKVINPDGRVEFNGGGWDIQEPFVRFDLLHNGLWEDDLVALENFDCAWIPGGATIIKRSAAVRVEHSEDFPNAFEDNDYSLQLSRLGYRLVNCPEARVIHHHRSFMDDSERDAEREYIETRERKKTITESLLAFYRRNRLAILDPMLFNSLGLSDLDDNQKILDFYNASLVEPLELREMV